MDEFCIAVGAFNEPCFRRDLQPDARVAQRTFSAITCDTVGSYNPNFWRLGGHHLSLTLQRGHAHSTSKAILTAPRLRTRQETIPLPANAITLNGLSKTYAATKRTSAKHALKGIDLAIPRGSIFGLLGPNGAGKSTLINILAGLVRKTAGTVDIWGFDQDTNPRQSRAAIGVMPQELNLDPFFSPRGALDVQAGLYGVPKAQRKTDEILEIVGLTDKADAYARSLSGGMRRRLLLGKALVHAPHILVLDEPTAGVDIELRNMLWTNIRKLNERGTTIILTTHYLEEAEEMCDEIAIINHGEVTVRDTTANLLGLLDGKTMLITTPNVPAELATPEGVNYTVNAAGQMEFTYHTSQTAADQILDLLRNNNIPITDVKTKDADLEDVFLNLTSAR